MFQPLLAGGNHLWLRKVLRSRDKATSAPQKPTTPLSGQRLQALRFSSGSLRECLRGGEIWRGCGGGMSSQAGLAPSVGPCTWGYSGHGQQAGCKSLLTPLRSLGQGWGEGRWSHQHGLTSESWPTVVHQAPSYNSVRQTAASGMWLNKINWLDFSCHLTVSVSYLSPLTTQPSLRRPLQKVSLYLRVEPLVVMKPGVPLSPW